MKEDELIIRNVIGFISTAAGIITGGLTLSEYLSVAAGLGFASVLCLTIAFISWKPVLDILKKNRDNRSVNG